MHRRPIEGTRAAEPTVGALAHDDTVTCRVTDRADEVGRRVAESSYPFALVLNAQRVLLGRVPASALADDPGAPVEQVMDPGPKTVRPHKTAEGTAQDLSERGLNWAIVTTPEGELIGVVSRAELEAGLSGGARPS